jgi:hypothetical protein
MSDTGHYTVNTNFSNFHVARIVPSSEALTARRRSTMIST